MCLTDWDTLSVRTIGVILLAIDVPGTNPFTQACLREQTGFLVCMNCMCICFIKNGCEYYALIACVRGQVAGPVCSSQTSQQPLKMICDCGPNSVTICIKLPLLMCHSSIKREVSGSSYTIILKPLYTCTAMYTYELTAA